MLQDLDETLETLLRYGLPPNIVNNTKGGDSADNEGNISFSFEAPNIESIGVISKPTINLFLYDVRENLELRNTVATVERQTNGTALRNRPPARVDCSYLITAWTVGAKPNTPQQGEHWLLGEVMKVLLRYPKLPAQVLQGSLVGQEPPLRALSLRPSQLQSLGEFWQAMGGKPKAALNYIVTISVPVDTTPETVPLVLESLINPEAEPDPAESGGRSSP